MKRVFLRLITNTTTGIPTARPIVVIGPDWLGEEAMGITEVGKVVGSFVGAVVGAGVGGAVIASQTRQDT